MPTRLEIPLCLPPIGETEIAAAVAVLRSGWLLMGERCAELEEALARACGRRHAVVVSSGTQALLLALQVAGVTAGDEVVVPDFTFPATASAAALLGARPVVVDVLPTTWNLDAAQAAAAVGPRTRVVMPVDQLGLPADEADLRAAQVGNGVRIVVDAACSIGARDAAGRPAGARGELACLSFHPRKTVTTGEGGAVLCDDDELARRLRRLRNHGLESGDFQEPGYNLRLTDFQAAMGLGQLARLEEMVDARRAIAARYRERLEPLARAGRLRFQEPAGAHHPYQTMAIALAPPGPREIPGAQGRSMVHRDAVRAALAERGIEAGLAGWALHRTRAYQAPASRFPIADELFATGISLPCFPELPLASVDRVADALLALTAGGL